MKIRGQEVQILIVSDSVLEDTLTEIMNFNLEFDFETKQQGYLGASSNETDEIFNGVKFDLELHMRKQAFFAFLKKIRDRAARKTPDTKFNISGVFNFPNGETPTITVGDAKFGAVPVNISSRGDYVKAKLQGVADDADITLS